MAARFAVIIPAAGKGERFGGGENKTLAKIDGRAIFLRSVEHFMNRDDVCATILVVSGRDFDEIKSKYAPNLAFMGVKLVEGGAFRMDSVAAGLKEVPDEADFVAIHDAVRPCVSQDMIDAVFAEVAKTGAAILASPLHGTIKKVGESRVIDKTIDRAGLYEAQTPQVFDRRLMAELYENPPAKPEDITDDAQLFELAGHPVSIVVSDATNLKITRKSDISLANAIIKSRPHKKVPKLGAFEEAQW